MRTSFFSKCQPVHPDWHAPLSSVLYKENERLTPPTFNVTPFCFRLAVGFVSKSLSYCPVPMQARPAPSDDKLIRDTQASTDLLLQLIKGVCLMFNISPRSFPCTRLSPRPSTED